MSNLSNINSKVFILDDLLRQVTVWESQQKKVVFTNGCFDLLHRGHIEYLAQTSDAGDKLIVAINSDQSVKSLNKGANRPLQDEYARALIIAALTFVDAVVIFDDHTPLNLIDKIKPAVLVKGGDYDPSVSDKNSKQYIVGSDIVRDNGGHVRVIQFVDGYSTSKIEEKIRLS